ncbi:hypothetical protein IT570_08625 [Candidatus Sumerlaeota bacterium]|nr:hypothetical protein [Candidatus Sumerlaeota bacterium]
MMNKQVGCAKLFAALLLAGSAFAGPVPGVETFDKKPVTFPTPPSITAWDIGSDEYLVTFKWKTADPNPGVAGDFNGWSRTDLPMSGPDADGNYSVTARLKAGEYRYKLVAGDSGWYTDEANPDRDEDANGNSILRLGIVAELHGRMGKLGDDEIVLKGLSHDSASFHYVDFISDRRVIIRARSLANDVSTMSVDRDGAFSALKRIASDAQFDYWETTVTVDPAKGAALKYGIQAVDGSKKETIGPFTVDLRAWRKNHAPDWAKDAIWYQIVIDRFRDGDSGNNPEETVGSNRMGFTWPWKSDFFAIPGRKEKLTDPGMFSYDSDKDNYPDIWQRLYGGDFQGVIDKLDYLQALGVNAIYFNPIFESPSHHKYNGKTYQFADDGYGVPGEFAKSMQSNNVFDPSMWKSNKSDEKFFELLREAKKRKMRVIIDGVFNHLGDSSPYFLDVKKNGKASPYADWWDVVSWDPFKARGWAGADELPQFRKNLEHGIASDKLREFIFNCTKKWMDPNGDGDPSDGIDGWRLDVPMDVPMAFWDEWCAHVRKINPDAYIVGEVWAPAEEWIDGRKFDAVMNYQFRVAALRFFGNVEKRTTVSGFDGELARLRLRYPHANTMVMQNLLDSHDTDRVASRLFNPDFTADRLYDGQNRVQDKGNTYKYTRPTPDVYQRLKLLALFQATYMGAPMIYYGTEVGMYGADDPMCRNPMWWPDLMPFDNPDDRIDESLLGEYQKLLKLRGGEELLRRGEFETLAVMDEKEVYAFRRYSLDEKKSILVVLNNSSERQTFTAPLSFATSNARLELLHGKADLPACETPGIQFITLEPVSGAIFAVTASASTKEVKAP